MKKKWPKKKMEQCKDDKHIWNRYLVNKVSKNNSVELIDIGDDDISSFSVCEKCLSVTFCKPVIAEVGVVDTIYRSNAICYPC